MGRARAIVFGALAIFARCCLLFSSSFVSDVTSSTPSTFCMSARLLLAFGDCIQSF